MNIGTDRTSKSTYLIYAIIIVTPFFVLYWMTPFLSRLTIGNDYPEHSIWDQMEFLFSLRHGSYPLYAPGYGGGSSSSIMTLGQNFHPITFIAAVMPGYWAGKALEIDTLLRLISLGFTQLALFIFLRKLKLNNTLSFIFSFITVYNLRMLDLFRYGASLENYTGFLLLCISIAWYYISPSRIWGPICIIGTTYLLICGGHPQMMYYGLVGAALLTLIYPYYFPLILPESDNQPARVLKFYLQVLTFCFIGILLSSIYIIPYYFEFLINNAGHVEQGYGWSLNNQDLVSGIVNNFLRPTNSDIHGAFGGTSLILLAAIIPLLAFFKISLPLVIWVLWGCLILCLLYMLGSHSPVHYLFWKYFPLAYSFRAPGRVSLILPPIILLLLVWLASRDRINFRLSGREISLYPYSIMASIGLFVYIFYNFILLPYILPYFSYTYELGKFSPAKLNAIPSWATAIILLSGLVSLAILIFYGLQKRNRQVMGLLICFIVFVQTCAVLRYGTWMRYKQDTQTFAQMKSDKEKLLTYRHHSGAGIYSKSIAYYMRTMLSGLAITKGPKPYFMFSEEFSFKPDFKAILAKFYRHYTAVLSNAEAYNLLKGRYSPDNAIIEGYTPQADIKKVKCIKGNGADNVVLTYSSYNRLNFTVSSGGPGFFVLSFPYDKNWQAYLNSEETKTYRANGIEQAVYTPGGKSQIEFRYWSLPAFIGMLISCVTLWLILSFISANLLPGKLRYWGILTVTVLMAGMFWLWNRSLYTGDNLGTKYVWTSESTPDTHTAD